MTVKELVELLAAQDQNATVVLDVALEQCTSDRNVLDVVGVRADMVDEEIGDWVFIDAGSAA